MWQYMRHVSEAPQVMQARRISKSPGRSSNALNPQLNGPSPERNISHATLLRRNSKTQEKVQPCRLEDFHIKHAREIQVPHRKSLPCFIPRRGSTGDW